MLRAHSAVDDTAGASPTKEWAESLPRWQIRAPLRDIVVAELVAAGLMVVAAAIAPWWALVVIGVLALMVTVVHYKGAHAAMWTQRWWRMWRGQRSHSRHRAHTELPEPFTVELAGMAPVGVAWDGQYAVTMIALHGRPWSPSILVPSGLDTVDVVPTEIAAALMHQFGGLELHNVDVVSVGRRTSASGRYTPKYDEIIGDRPAVGLLRVWLVLRLCPQTCMEAIAYRGDVARAVAAATERMRQAVLRQGCRATLCTAAQMKLATTTLLAGNEQLEPVREHWTHLDLGKNFVTSYRIAGEDLSTDLLSDIWTVRSQATATLVRVAPGPDGQPTVGALVRFHTPHPFTEPPLLALKTAPGEQLSALMATLPLGNRSMDFELSRRDLHHSRLVIPASSSGYVVGMTNGFPMLMSLTDPLRFTKVAIDADIAVVQQQLLRASATGATVQVHTRRPHLWEPICGDRITLATNTSPPVTPTVVVLDGDDIDTVTGGERGRAVVTIGTAIGRDNDIVIEQRSTTEMTLTTPQLNGVTLTIMWPRNETAFLAHLRRARR
jgi:type VII secretion protein EccE